jgi:hypothetical protein
VHEQFYLIQALAGYIIEQLRFTDSLQVSASGVQFFMRSKDTGIIL